MSRFGISIPDELQEEIDSQLEYGDKRSDWVQEAIELRLAIEEQGFQKF